VQGVHIVQKVCIDRGEVTSAKLKRDSVEPLSAEVQGVHRKEICFEFREDRTTEGSVELCQEGIERVHRVHQRNLFRVLRKGKYRREDTHIVVEYSVGSTRCASSRRMPGGHREFSFQENFLDPSLEKYSVASGVCESGLALSP
jgi:hypothetical protein